MIYTSIFNKALCHYLRYSGAIVGNGVSFKKWPDILLRDNADLNLIIGDNVKIDDKLYIRIRHQGVISIYEGARLCKDTWLTTGNKGILIIGKRTIIGPYNIINAGHGVQIGDDCVFSSFINITSSDHNLAKGVPIMQQGFNGKEVTIGNNVLIGSHVFIKQGVNIGNDAVVGAGSIVLGDVAAGTIVGGNPARFIKDRT